MLRHLAGRQSRLSPAARRAARDPDALRTLARRLNVPPVAPHAAERELPQGEPALDSPSGAGDPANGTAPPKPVPSTFSVK